MTQADPSGAGSSQAPSTPPSPRPPAPAAARASDTEVVRVVSGTDTYTCTLDDGKGETLAIDRNGTEVPSSAVGDLVDTAALVGVQLAIGALPPANQRVEYTFNEADPGSPELVSSEDANA